MESQSLNKLKYINLDGTILYYRCFTDLDSYTEFYKNSDDTTPIFRIMEDCDCPKLSRGWWRDKILTELEKLNNSN
jgi:hypothetical protein